MYQFLNEFNIYQQHHFYHYIILIIHHFHHYQPYSIQLYYYLNNFQHFNTIICSTCQHHFFSHNLSLHYGVSDGLCVSSLCFTSDETLFHSIIFVHQIIQRIIMSFWLYYEYFQMNWKHLQPSLHTTMHPQSPMPSSQSSKLGMKLL